MRGKTRRKEAGKSREREEVEREEVEEKKKESGGNMEDRRETCVWKGEDYFEGGRGGNFLPLPVVPYLSLQPDTHTCPAPPLPVHLLHLHQHL